MACADVSPRNGSNDEARRPAVKPRTRSQDEGSSPSPSVYGQSVTLTATVAAVDPGAGTPTGTVTFFDGETSLGTGTAAGTGVWTIATPSLSVGTHADITAQYSGNVNFLSGDSADFSQTVNQADTLPTLTSSVNPSVSGQTVTLTATVAPGAGTPTGTVTFYDGGGPIGDGTLTSPGVWSLSTSSLSVGQHPDITAIYNGSPNFHFSESADFSQTVDQATSVTTVTASPNPSVSGQSVTLTATVAAVSPGAGTPTGTVTFFDGGSELGVGTAARPGVWTFATSSLSTNASPGHSITAVYSGDVNFEAVTSAPLTVVVDAARTNGGDVVSSAPQTSYGQEVTLTAAFNSTDSGSGPITGTAAFYDGTTYLGTAPLVDDGTAALPAGVSGHASLSTEELAVGGHIITAIYSGDINYAPATSETPALVVVAEATSTTTLTAATTAEGTTLIANVVVTSPGDPPVVGTVAFYDGTTPLGTKSVANGVATLNVSALAARMQNFSAVFTGDGTTSRSQTSLVISTANPTITSVARFGFRSQPSYLLLNFSTPLNPASAEDLSNYSLVGPIRRKGVHGYAVKIRSAVYDPATQTVTLAAVGRWNIHWNWQLTVAGNSPGGVKGTSGAMLDGTARGQYPSVTIAGRNYVKKISIRSLRGGRASKLPTLGLANSVSDAMSRAVAAAVPRSIRRRHRPQ